MVRRKEVFLFLLKSQRNRSTEQVVVVEQHDTINHCRPVFGLVQDDHLDALKVTRNMEVREMEEQDISLVYLQRSGSSTESIASRLPSRKPSPTPSHASIDPIKSLQVPVSPIKSPSLSNVRDTHSGLRLPTVAPLARSRTLPCSPKSGTIRSVSSELTAFEFQRDRALRMSQWVLAFVIGECHVFYID